MKILCLGCLHGKISKKLKDKIKKEDFDYVLCTGDLANADEMRKLFFRYWDLLTLGYSFEDFVNKKKLDRLKRKEIKSMQLSINFLHSLGKKVLLVYGNNDILRENLGNIRLKALEDRIKNTNIRLVKHGKIKLDNHDLVCDSGLYCQDSHRLKHSFSRTKNAIFMTHAPAYGHFDIVKWKASPRYGEHVGDVSYLEAIRKFRPIMHLSSHMHEHQGRKRLGRTWIINTGAAYLGRYAIIDVDKRIRGIKFVK